MNKSLTVRRGLFAILKKVLQKYQREEKGIAQKTMVLLSKNLNYPSFLEEWGKDQIGFLEFITLFETSMESSNIPNMAKFCHLKSSLMLPALNTINNIPLCEESYKVAIQKLKAKYANHQELLHLQLNKLISMKTPGEEGNPLNKSTPHETRFKHIELE